MQQNLFEKIENLPAIKILLTVFLVSLFLLRILWFQKRTRVLGSTCFFKNGIIRLRSNQTHIIALGFVDPNKAQGWGAVIVF